MSGEITLAAGGRRLSAWQKVAVTRSLDSAVSTMNAEIAHREPGARSALVVPAGGEVEVYVGEVRVIRGYLDVCGRRRAAGTRGTTITVRSRTCDVVESHPVGSAVRWRQTRIADIARELCQPFGVEVVAPQDTPILERHAMHRGDTVMRGIESACEASGYLITDDGDGRLVLTRGASRTSRTVVEVGRNAVGDSSCNIDASQRFSLYLCDGARATDADTTGLAASDVRGRATDASRHRVKVIIPERRVTPERARRLCEWEAATRLGRSTQLNYAVRGWTDEDGELWSPGTLVRILDPEWSIDGTFIAHTVTLSQDRQSGRLARLDLAPEAAYEFLEPAPPTARKPKAPTAGVGAWVDLVKGVVGGLHL